MEPLKDFGILSNKRILKLFYFINGSDLLKNGKPNFNKGTYQKLKSGYEFTNPKELSGHNLNVLRQEMALEVIQNIRKWSDKSLFYIEAPTWWQNKPIHVGHSRVTQSFQWQIEQGFLCISFYNAYHTDI
ncbi:MAG: hypothetical protein IPM86_05195 [Saprospiraceae bacterium]|nr:hypothetical protein [Saprospiraceae bacterium]